MSRTSTGLLPGLVVVAFAACAGGGHVQIEGMDVIPDGDAADADTGEATEEIGDAPDADAPEGEIAQPPSLEMVFQTATGPKGRDTDTVSLALADEPEAWLQTPGFQMDVAILTTGLEDGGDVRLYVAGNLVATAQAGVDPLTGAGTATFAGVTLTHNPAGYEVRAEAVGQQGQQAQVAKTVKVDIGTCGIALTPTNNACVLADADPTTEGLQVVFAVSNPDRTCTTAVLKVTSGGTTTATEPAALDASGAAQVTVTLLDHTDDVDGVVVQVVAEVSDSEHADRTAATAALDFTLDLADPVLAITSPAKALLTLKDDKDSDPSNGLTLDAAGTAAGTSGSLEVTLNGAPAGTPLPEPDGTWRVPDLALLADGGYVVAATGRDACGRTGHAEFPFQARVTQATLVLVSPTAGAVLLAKDDGNAATPLVYETTVQVQGDAVEAGTTLTARCRENRVGATEVAVGSLAVQTPARDSLYPIPVALPVQVLTSLVSCRVSDDAANPSTSGDVAFVVGLPAPDLRILKPVAGAFVTKTRLDVAIAATNLDYVVPEVRVLDGTGTEALSFTPPAPIRNGGLSFALPLAVGGQPLADGLWTLDVQASDGFGNRAADTPASIPQAAFTLDTAAPEVQITAPAADTLDPGTNPGDADQDAAQPGYQATVGVAVTSGDGAGTKVCLAVNGDRTCRTLATGETTATFTGVTLVPGANDLSAQATDPAGNTGASATRTITLVLPGPRVRIVTPDRNGPVAVLPFDLVVKVTDASDAAQAGAPVTVSVNGTGTYGGTTDANGTATFPVATLSETGDTFIARATVGGIEGVSAPRVLSFKAGQPVLSFRVPTNEDVINASYAACAAGQTNCLLDVLLDAQDIEDGSAGELTVTCLSSTAKVAGFVSGSTLTFPDVVLYDQRPCTLTATATDLANQTVTAGPISVRVDRTVPRITRFSSPDPLVGALTYAYDEDKVAPGLQFTFKAYVTGLKAGSVVALSYGLDGGAMTDVTATLGVDAPDGIEKEVSFPQVTLQNGLYTLLASVTDESGNHGQLSRVVQVVVDQPVLRLVSPVFVDRVACTTSATCPPGAVCAEGFCATPWAASTAKNLIVSVTSLPSGSGNLRVCSNRAGLSGTPCSTTGYRQVALASSSGEGNVTVPVTGLVDGSYRFVAEGLLASGQPWVSTADSPNATERFRHVYQDTVAPEITAISSPSDTLPPAGVLNAAEQVAAGTFSIRVVASEAGRLVLVQNGADGTSSDAFPGDMTLDAVLREGANEVHARVTDLVGNVSVQPPDAGVTYYRPTVDTVAPTLAFDHPASPALKAGESRDIVVSSDAIGRTVTLLDLGAPKGTATVALDGTATFAYASLPVLTDGDHELEARVDDEAGNPAAATQAVHVDTGVPGALIAAPLDGAVLADADDARPGLPGFQIEVSFGSPSLDASSWQVQLAANCDATFTTCDAPARIAQGAITVPGGLEPSLFPTLPAAATPYYKVIVVVSDGVGNLGSATANVTVNLLECQVGLSGIGTGTFINNQSCPAPGTDCATATLTVTVTVSTACGAVDTVRLLQSGMEPQELPLTGQSAQFTATVTDDTTPTFEARAFEGGSQSGSSGVLPRTVDLSDPIVAFTYPVAGSNNHWGLKNDGNSVAPGLQRSLIVEASDTNLAGGQVSSLTYGGSALPPTNLSLPYALAATPASVNFSVTFADQTSGTTTVTVADAAGNEASSSFTLKADLQAPAAPTLQALVADPRRPAVTLDWSAVGDNGTSGGAATSYDIRYSPVPITTEAAFNAACRASGLAYDAAYPAPAAPGSGETYTVTGPDIRDPAVTESGTPCRFVAGTNPSETNYAFAVRAIDAVGNPSPFSTASVADVDLALRYALISGTGTPYGDPLLNKRVASVGDLDGDGQGDVAVGGGTGTMGDTFCVVYGNSTGTGKTVPDLEISSATGARHLCLTGTSGSYFGVPVAEAGDVNGDGVGDLLVGEGKSAAQAVKVWFGVAGGPLAAAPNLAITGSTSNVNSVSMAGAGDFDGDGVDDLLIGSRSESKVFVVPGNSTWTAATSLAIDLQSATDRATYGIVTMVMAGGDATTRFGFRLAFVGDLDGDGKDEAAVATYAVPSQVLVFQGRALPGDSTISVAATSGGTDDATVVRLAPDAPNSAGSFGNTALAGVQDLDRDGTPDIVVTHASAGALAGSKTVYMFRGGYLKTRFGQTVQVLATSGTGNGIVQNERGFVISGVYDIALPIGNFDNDPDGTPELAYIIPTSGAHGKVFIRRNARNPSGAFPYGTMPYEAPVLVDPLDPTGVRFGYFGAIPVGDFNGDGFPDLLVGTDGAGYAMIVY